MMPQVDPQRSRELLATPISTIKGVGPRVAEKLAKLNIRTVEDALYTLPFRYEDRREIRKIAQLREGIQEVFYGEVLAAGETRTSRSRRAIYEVVVGDGSATIALKWFHFRPNWMKTKYKPGTKAIFSGEMKRFGAIREIHHPDTDFLPAEQDVRDWSTLDPENYGRVLSIYPLTEGLHQKSMRRIMQQAVTHFAPYVVSSLPEQVRDHYQLLSLDQALLQVHLPDNSSDILQLNAGTDPARRALVFDEFFFLELGLALKRQGMVLKKGIKFSLEHKFTLPLTRMLPFKLTDAQRRVLGEIKQDLLSGQVMNRMVQGDVGSGKTMVALMTALIAIENDYQVAVVAPTEILAEQHYLQFHYWLEQLGLKATLLQGSMTAKTKKLVLDQISSGVIDLVVGTHAVLQQGVDFRRLGLGIIDEQHRFGVEQRMVLREKGINPHILVMTATPIPRSLALTLFGDLSLSIIDQLPPGRMPISTRIIPDVQRDKAWQLVRSELTSGHQVYIVYPLIEESEKSDLLAATQAFEHLSREVFPDYCVGMLHGKMRSDEKEAVMREFKDNLIQLLVSTTVIEVGIDVPNATCIVIEHAERFGLSQLHQLRGRVGRGSAASNCLLLRSSNCTEDGFKRLAIMAETQDGFRIAEEDLKIRGPGDFLGTRQSGLPDFRIASLLRDNRLLEIAREAAFNFSSSVDLFSSPDDPVMQTLVYRWGQKLDLASAG
jgi:ATP-dependent DNA helicase RecG